MSKVVEGDGEAPRRRGCVRRTGAGCVGVVAIAAIAFAVVSFSGLGSKDRDGEPSVRCEPVAREVVSGITEGLTVQGGGSLQNAQAVKSNDFEDVWFVAADLEGAGLDRTDDIGVWATNSITGVASIFAADSVAKEFSEWGDAGWRFKPDDDGMTEARECARKVT